MEHMHRNKNVAAAAAALMDAIRVAYPGLLPALEDMAIEVVTERGAIQVRAVNAETGELAAAAVPAPATPATTAAGGGLAAAPPELAP